MPLLISHCNAMNNATTFETAATLRDGLAVTIRHLRPEDRDAIARAAAGLDAETIYTRLFSYRPVTAAAIDRIIMSTRRARFARRRDRHAA